MEAPLRDKEFPRVIFVTGGPGTGKGTQCANLVTELGYSHVSVGDIMREEIRSGSEEGQSILSIVQSGNLVPKELTISLLLKKLQSMEADIVLVDGFPRSAEQAIYLEHLGVNIDYILHFDTDREDILLDRLIERGRTSGRADDNEETILKRFFVYKAESVPVLALYEPFGYVRKVDCLAGIPLVLQRTLRALRCELFCLIGPKFGGKTNLAKDLQSVLRFKLIDLEDLKVKYEEGRKVVIQDDVEVVNVVVYKLLHLKNDYRVMLENFPENEVQMHLFNNILGEPDRVVYVKCEQDISQMRILSLSKNDPNFMNIGQYSQLYRGFSDQIAPVLKYYQQSLGNCYGEVNGGSNNQETAKRQFLKVIAPEVVQIRGSIRRPFLTYLKNEGYNLVNAAMLLKLYIGGRHRITQKVDEFAQSDDFSLINILIEKILSGNAQKKFAVYNFARFDTKIAQLFESSICPIKTIYYLDPPQKVIPDRVTLQYFKENRLVKIPTGKLGFTENVRPIEEQYIRDSIQNFSERTIGQVIWIIGPTCSGKTEIFNYLSQYEQVVTVDLAEVSEEYKNYISTDEDPKDTLTLTEFAKSINYYLKKNPQKILIFDGLLAQEYLSLADPLFPELSDETEQLEEGAGPEDDPNLDFKALDQAARFQHFLSLIPLLCLIECTAEEDILQKRAKAKNEIPEEEEISPETKLEILEANLFCEKLDYVEDKTPWTIPDYTLIDTTQSTTKQLRQLIDDNFQHKLILVSSEFYWLDNLMSQFAFQNDFYFVSWDVLIQQLKADSEQFKEQIEANWNLSLELKAEILQKLIANRPKRTLVTILYDYPISNIDPYMTHIEELVQLEHICGKIQVYFTFATTKQKSTIEKLPTRKRKVPIIKEENEDEENEEEKVVEIEEEEEIVPMWNNFENSNFAQAFAYLNGREATRNTFENPELDKIYDLLASAFNNLSEKQLIMVQMTSDTSLKLFREISECDVPPSPYFQQDLPLDISDLGELQLRIEENFTNERAKQFFFENFCSFSIPFHKFYEAFCSYLRSQDINPSAGLYQVIRNIIDVNRNHVIDADDVNQFFTRWEDSSKRQEILNLAQSTNIQRKQDKLGYNLLLIVESSQPNSETSATSFQAGDIIELNYEGYQKSPNFRADGITYAGRQSKQVSNDIEFHTADTRIKFSHFNIISKKEGYHIVDCGSVEGIFIKLQTAPVILFTGAVVRFGNNKCRIIQCSVEGRIEPQGAVRKFEFCKFQEQQQQQNKLEIQFLTGRLQGMKFEFDQQTPYIIVGSEFDSDIQIDQHLNLNHAFIKLTEYGWTIQDNFSVQGTWIAVNQYDSMITGKPSFPLKIQNNTLIQLPGVTFRAIFKGREDIIPTIQSSNGIREVDFAKYYHLQQGLIGEGSYAYILKCTEISSGNEYAVKVLLPNEDSFEVQGLQELDHPNIVKVYDMILYQKKLLIVQELCKGGDLFDRIIARGNLTEEGSRVIIKQLLSALAYLHQKDIIHRDIKPENICFAQDQEDSPIKLIDFGSAVVGQSSQKIGSAYYVAPEVLSGKYDFKSDIWSAGVLSYILICGQVPYNGNNDAQVMQAIKEGNPITYDQRQWGVVSKHCRRFIASMLIRDPKKRPSAQDLLNSPWLQGKVRYLDTNKPIAVESLGNLKKFNSTTKLQQAIMYFIANRVMQHDKEKEYQQLFFELDKDNSGTISREELKQAFMQTQDFTEEEINKIMDEVDINQSGQLEYSEFLTAVIQRTKIVSTEILQKTFEVFDEDGSGDITSEELKRMFGSSLDEWSKLIEQVDSNEDGKIDIKEFKNMMLAFVDEQVDS